MRQFSVNVSSMHVYTVVMYAYLCVHNRSWIQLDWSGRTDDAGADARRPQGQSTDRDVAPAMGCVTRVTVLECVEEGQQAGAGRKRTGMRRSYRNRGAYPHR